MWVVLKPLTPDLMISSEGRQVKVILNGIEAKALLPVFETHDEAMQIAGNGNQHLVVQVEHFD